METIAADLQSSRFVADAVRATRDKFRVSHAEDIASATVAIEKLEDRSTRLLEMASELATPALVLRKIDEIEQ